MGVRRWSPGLTWCLVVMTTPHYSDRLFTTSAGRTPATVRVLQYCLKHTVIQQYSTTESSKHSKHSVLVVFTDEFLKYETTYHMCITVTSSLCGHVTVRVLTRIHIHHTWCVRVCVLKVPTVVGRVDFGLIQNQGPDCRTVCQVTNQSRVTWNTFICAHYVQLYVLQ